MKELLYSGLSQKGIFAPEEIQAFLNDSNKQLLLYRLAKSHFLFSPTTSNIEGVTVALNELLPYSQLSPFHLYFVKYCIDNEIPSVLTAYLDTHHLATSTSEVELLMEELAKQYGRKYAVLNDEEPNTRWVKLLFLFRTRENLVEASLLNAKIVLKVSKENDNTFSVNSIIASTTTRDKRFLMALGTLAYAPISLRGI
jgi:hypothetical protein